MECYMTKYLCMLFFFLMTIESLAESITSTCYEPKGKRFDLNENAFSEVDDGYSNSNPTFYFSTENSKILIESWAAALPFPEMLNRSKIDTIVPPTVKKSNIMYRSEEVIHAVSSSNRDIYTTTLYLNRGSAVFTRVRLGIDVDMGMNPMGAIYKAQCVFTRIP